MNFFIIIYAKVLKNKEIKFTINRKIIKSSFNELKSKLKSVIIS